jgi:hypothetical protein
MTMALHFLESTHPVYDAWKDEWAQNERRAAGGSSVLQELVPFVYELQDGDQHKNRKAQASYLNFMDQAASGLTGHLARSAPAKDSSLNFGTLGAVTRPAGQTLPNMAELVYYNIDGVGVDGSQWDNWWIGVLKRASHTGHRWCYVESTEEAPTTVRDVMDGKRPYMREFSPLEVRNWHYEHGQLQFAIVRIPQSRPILGDDGRLKGQKELGYLLLVRKGFEGLGEAYQDGGWWKYDHRKEEQATGGWEKTGGDIPLFPLFYERWQGTNERPAFSRPGTTEVGQVAVAYMNAASAARFDAWEAASSMTMLLGVTPAQYEVTAAKMREGSRLVPVPPHPETGTIPQVHDASMGSVPADVFRGVLEGLREEARELTLREATSAPGSSGESKRMGFEELKAPKLSELASNLEQAQNTALNFLERRFGNDNPTGSVTWPKEFDLRELVDDIQNMFDLERLTGLRSKTVAVKGMTRAAQDYRVVESDDEVEAIREEYGNSFDERATTEDRANRFGAELGLEGF